MVPPKLRFALSRAKRLFAPLNAGTNARLSPPKAQGWPAKRPCARNLTAKGVPSLKAGRWLLPVKAKIALCNSSYRIYYTISVLGCQPLDRPLLPFFAFFPCFFDSILWNHSLLVFFCGRGCGTDRNLLPPLSHQMPNTVGNGTEGWSRGFTASGRVFS